MEDTRIQILNYIERNCKVDPKELAVLLGTDEATVQKEIGDMEREKIICGYHTMIDWDKAGMDQVNALIEVHVTPQRGRGYEKIAERIYNYPEVSSVSLISGAYDFLVTIEGKSLMEVSRFVSEKLSPIDGVMSTATHFILKKYKDHGTILAQTEKEERMLVTP